MTWTIVFGWDFNPPAYFLFAERTSAPAQFEDHVAGRLLAVVGVKGMPAAGATINPIVIEFGAVGVEIVLTEAREAQVAGGGDHAADYEPKKEQTAPRMLMKRGH